MDEFEIRKRMDLAAKAKAVQDNELITALWEEFESDLMQEWRTCHSTQGRENVYYKVTALREIQYRIKALVKDGELAAEDLAREYP